MAEPKYNLSLLLDGVSFNELCRGTPGNESGRERISEKGWSASRVLICQWSQRHELALKLMGGVESDGTFTPPQSYPYLDGLFVTDIDIEGWGRPRNNSSLSVVEYPFAVLGVKYGTPDGNAGSAEFGNLVEQFDFGGEVITMPQGSFFFDLGEEVFDEDGNSLGTLTNDYGLGESAQPGKVMPSGTYVINVSASPAPPWTDMQDLIGKVNDATYSPLGDRSFPAGTLLYLGTSDERQISFDPSDGSDFPTWRLTYRFAYRRIPWNRVFQPETFVGPVGWCEVHDFDGNTIFETGDFGLLT